MSSKEINFNQMSMRELADCLKKEKNGMESAQKKLKQADGLVVASLKGTTKASYQQRTQKIDKEFTDCVQAFERLITQLEKTETTATETDRIISLKMQASL